MEIIKRPPIWVDGWQGTEDDWYDFDEESGIDDGETVWADDEDD